MKFVISREYNTKLIRELRRATMPDSPAFTKNELEVSEWWTARVRDTQEIVGYAGLADEDGFAMLLSVGVLKDYRGRGLQRRLIRVRERRARQLGYLTAISYTAVQNLASARSLIREGYLPYCYEKAGYTHYEKDLTK